MTQLYLFQIGPVQALIAQARRTADLYYGSFLLSQLAQAGLQAAQHIPGFEPIFPYATQQDGSPHRFAFLGESQPETVAQQVEATIRQTWHKEFALPVFKYLQKQVGSGDWEKVFERQSLEWLEFYWVAVPYDPDDHTARFQQASRAMAQRRLLRTFPQVDEDGAKCSVTGLQSALPLNWTTLQAAVVREFKTDTILRDNEQLGTLMTIKRLAPFANRSLKRDDRIRSVRAIAADNPALSDDDPDIEGKSVMKYLAVLHMDGDRMGKTLSEMGDTRPPQEHLSAHQRFSANLAQFANVKAQEIIENEAFGGKTGTLIYTGGDDVLALLPVANVLRCALALRNAFVDITGCQMSAGIAITPENLPLDMALELARDAEERAKEQYGRDAVVVLEAHGSGLVRPAGGKWDVIPLIDALVQLFHYGWVSGKLSYDLQALAHDMGGRVPAAARQAEVKRLVARRMAEGLNDEQKAYIDTVRDEVVRYGETVSWSDTANWVILARFLGQDSRLTQEEGVV